MNLEPPDHNFRFDSDYHERIELRDGSHVVLRLLRPEDRDKLEHAFNQLSWESRYSRFLGPKSRLSDRELEYLVNVDQYNHLAIGAMIADGPRKGEGIGIARCVRLHDRPNTAEAAVTILDEFQKQGLGRIMLVRLVAAAIERGIETFRATLFAQNKPMKALLEDLGDVDVVERGGPVVTLDVDLYRKDKAIQKPAKAPEPATKEASEQMAPLRRILSLAGEGAVSLVDKFRPLMGDEETEREEQEEDEEEKKEDREEPDASQDEASE